MQTKKVRLRLQLAENLNRREIIAYLICTSYSSIRIQNQKKNLNIINGILGQN
jgi:hypothetical protein